MTNDTETCAAVLTRCGAYARSQALELVPTLAATEVEELARLHAGLLKTDELPPADAPEIDKQKFRAAQTALLAEIGGRYRTLTDAIADRQAKEAAAKEPPGVSGETKSPKRPKPTGN